MQGSHNSRNNYIKNKCGGKTEMLLTDIDSFMYKIEAENVYEAFIKIKSYLTYVFTQKI